MLLIMWGTSFNGRCFGFLFTAIRCVFPHPRLGETGPCSDKEEWTDGRFRVFDVCVCWFNQYLLKQATM